MLWDYIDIKFPVVSTLGSEVAAVVQAVAVSDVTTPAGHQPASATPIEQSAKWHHLHAASVGLARWQPSSEAANESRFGPEAAICVHTHKHPSKPRFLKQQQHCQPGS